MTLSATRDSVAIIGGGTQGRRLAYMWSSRGNDVHLVDAQASQLEGSHKAIEGFRSASSRRNPQWGKIVTHLPSGLAAALQSAWLVVEVLITLRLLVGQCASADFGSVFPNSSR
ncbi:hypothetical protein jhhlp_006904 [Lomentospora prolificans]|uniref:3-hydroxyacyl-CoA dehydrogenase NAD binding domain-containing protein n=1 Tax=Lomentospora prolificans TaxID=41688 RepID=A0A2N3N329_9PEZI|nr:hypothetical protein jhhlp_006904 [Lomentospora prolificans]